MGAESHAWAPGAGSAGDIQKAIVFSVKALEVRGFKADEIVEGENLACVGVA